MVQRNPQARHRRYTAQRFFRSTIGSIAKHDVRGRDIGQPFQLNPSALSLNLRDLVSGSTVEVIGNGFTANSGVKVAHQFETVGLDGVSHLSQGDALTSADPDGHFEGMTFALPGRNFNIQARATDVATGRNVDSAVLRPQV